VFKSGLTTLSTRASGAKTKPMAEASSGMLMVIFTRVSGRTTRQMDSEFTSTSMALNTKVTGKTISKMDKEWRVGKTVADMREDIKRV